MTITELIPTVKDLSHTDKLLLLQILVQELLKSEGVAEVKLPDSNLYELTEPPALEVKEASLTLEDRRAFLKQPLAERRRILAAQAEAMQTHYKQNPEWQELMAGDIVDY
ncbi:MAG: hypothetical protein AAFV72_14895 [Cyanobacteria bacterium J06635_1]